MTSSTPLPPLPPLPGSETAGQNPRFTIDILPIVSKEDKFAPISQLSLVQDFSVEKFWKLWFQEGTRGYIRIRNINSVFVKNIAKLWITPDSQDELNIDHIRNSWVLFFKVNEVNIYGGFIFINSSDGTFMGVADKYLQKGLSELSITKPSEIEWVRNRIKLSTTFSHENWILNIKVTTKLHNIAADGYCIADVSNKRVCALKDDTLRYYTYDDNECFPDAEIFDLSTYGIVKELATDPNNNFYFIITEQEWVSKLRILNRKTLTEVQDPFEGINKIVHMSHPTGKLLCMDTEGYLRIIQISTNALPRGYVDQNDLTIESNKARIVQVQDTSRHALAKALADGDISIDTSLLTWWVRSTSESQNDRTLVEQIWRMPVWSETFAGIFAAASTLDEIDFVSRAFDQISRNPTIAQVSGILTPIERDIREKRWNILVESLTAELEQIRVNLGMMSDFSALIALQHELRDMRQRRSQVPTVSPALDEGIRELTRLLDEKVSEYQKDHEDEIYASVDASLSEIEGYLSSIDYMTGLTSVYTYDAWESAESQIAYLSPVKQDEYRDRMHILVKSRQGELQKLSDTEKSSEATKLKKKLSEIEGFIAQVENIVWAVENEKSLSDMEHTDPLVLRIRDECELLQPSEKDRLLLLLGGTFRDRARDIRLARLDTKWATQTLDEYGLDTGLYYSERGYQSISYTVWGKRTPSGMIRLELRLENGAEHVYDFDKYLSDPSAFTWVMKWKMAEGITPEMTQAEFVVLQSQIAGWKQTGKSDLQKLQFELSHANSTEKKTSILKNIQQLKARYKKARFLAMLVDGITREKKINPRPHLQTVNDRFIVLDEEREIIKRLSDGMMIQKETGKGIDILEWPPGLGKTEIVRFVAWVTNREIIRVQCAKMDPSDMFFSPQLKAGETSRHPAEWIQLMQKPWVVVLFDEIDKLSPECFDRLHSLFDGGRSVFDPQIGSFRAHKDAVFLGTRNSYEKMTNPITSRGTIILMNAPGELNEAFKVSKYTNLPYFEKMDFAEFQRQYTRFTWATWTTDPNEKVITSIFENIRWLVRILNALRTKQKSDNFDDKFEYELSYRDAEQIFLRYNRNPWTSFKEKVKEVLIPKVRAVVFSVEDKELQEKIAVGVIDANF